MIGLIVTGHANFGSGMTSSVNLIAGEQEAYRYVDFLPTYGTEELTEEIAKAMDELKDCEELLSLQIGWVDRRLTLSLHSDTEKKMYALLRVQNLPMLVEIVMSRKFMDDLDGLVESVRQEKSR